MALVTLVGWTISRLPMTLSGSSPRAAEGQQHQHLVAGEGQLVRLEHLVEAGEQDLLDPEDRRGGPHRRGRTEPLLPRLPGPLDRVEGQPQRSHHGPNATVGRCPRRRDGPARGGPRCPGAPDRPAGPGRRESPGRARSPGPRAASRTVVGLHALGDHVHAQRVRQAEGRLDDGRGARVGGHGADEGSVELEPPDVVQVAEVAQRAESPCRSRRRRARPRHRGAGGSPPAPATGSAMNRSSVSSSSRVRRAAGARRAGRPPGRGSRGRGDWSPTGSPRGSASVPARATPRSAGAPAAGRRRSAAASGPRSPSAGGTRSAAPVPPPGAPTGPAPPPRSPRRSAARPCGW